nr:MAG TPA: hypothetical protein [Caudoviricetes sp.]
MPTILLVYILTPPRRQKNTNNIPGNRYGKAHRPSLPQPDRPRQAC